MELLPILAVVEEFRMSHKKIALLAPAFLVIGASVLGGGSTPLAAAGSATGDNRTDRPVVYRALPDGRVVATASADVPDAPAFARFANWLERYSNAPADKKAQMEGEGVKLATERRAAMAALIPRDPKRALELSIGLHQRKGLPVAVVNQLEQVLQGRARYIVSDAGRLTFNDKTYKAFVYGRREGLMGKYNLPFYGVALDDAVALHESPIHVLPKGAVLPAGVTLGKTGTKSPVSGKEASGGVVGIVGTTAYYFDTQQELQSFTEQLWAAENVIGPNEHG